jgi:elongation factor G
MGKTSLGEALLFNAKATSRLGKVLEGNSVLDFEPEEQKEAVIDLQRSSQLQVEEHRG